MKVSLTQWKQVATGIIASLGVASQGIAAAFSSSAIPQMRAEGAEFYVTDKQASLIAAILYFTAAAGNLSAGPLMNLYGRKLILLLSAIPIIIGFILVAAGQDFITMMIGRGLIGFFTGSALPTAAVYISESTEASIRGTVGLFVQFSFTIGNLLEYLIGAVTPNWRIMTWISTAVPITFLFCMLLLPETPRYLISKKKYEAAFTALAWLRASTYDIQSELDEIKESMKGVDGTHVKKKGLLTLHNFKMYGIALMLGILFGTCGGTVFVLFAEPLIVDLNSMVSPKVVSIIMGVAQLVGMCISIYLVEIVGRRRLLQISGASMSVTALSLSLFSFLFSPELAKSNRWNYLPAILAIGFMFCFALGYRGIPFGLAADLLPTDIRGFGTASTCLCGAVSISVLSGFYLPMITVLKIHGTFLFYGCICFVCFLFPTLFVPETRGKSLEALEIETKQNGIFMGLTSRKYPPNNDTNNGAVENYGFNGEP